MCIRDRKYTKRNSWREKAFIIKRLMLLLNSAIPNKFYCVFSTVKIEKMMLALMRMSDSGSKKERKKVSK